METTQPSDTFNKEMRKARFYVEEVKETLDTLDKDDLKTVCERVCQLYNALENTITTISGTMLDNDKSLEEVKSWTKSKRDETSIIREFRNKLKQELAAISESERQKEHERSLHEQRVILEEQVKMNQVQQQQREEERVRCQKQEEEWFFKKLELEKELNSNQKGGSTSEKPQEVKLQKYTITPFEGDYRDWLRFWNQFIVEVDSSGISKISKFNYLLELVKGKPKQDILGLPHTEDGYEEAKRILSTTYGKDCKVYKALIKELESLPAITNANKVRDTHSFFNTLARTVRTLTTMKKLDGAQGYIYSIMDKLGPVREAVTMKDENWEEWGLADLVESLRKYTDRNPLTPRDLESLKTPLGQQGPDKSRRDKMFMMGMGRNQQRKPQGCVYCGLDNHRSTDCSKVLDIASRKEILQRKKLCYNCTGHGHLASKCRSRSCNKCNGRHHTSLCDVTTPGKLPSSTFNPPPNPPEKNFGVRDVNATIQPSVIAKVNGVQARILMDTGASSSYICTDLISQLGIKPSRSERKVIEQIYGTVDKTVEVHKVCVESNAVENFKLDLECINAEKPVLTCLPNPHIGQLKDANQRLRRLNFCDEEATEESLPVHIIMGAADFQRIKTTEPPILGPNPDSDPGAEFTELGWIVSGKGTLSTNQQPERTFLLTTSQEEFEKMCSLEVLGLSDDPKQAFSHEDFQEKLHRLADGTYSTRLPWKPDHPALPSNEGLTIARLRSTTNRLEKMGKLEEYHGIMQQQLEEGILERVPESPTGDNIHYVPHQPVIKENAESTKLRIVYDCSAKEAQQPSLNDCLETGPSLQPKLFDILLRNRTKPNCVTGDIRKAFLQVKIDPEDRDALRLLWYNNLEDRQIVPYRFTRVVFGSGPSPYILGATIQKHVAQYAEVFPQTVEDLLRDTYVDDVQSGGEDAEELQRFKREATQIMAEGGFQLHKWHSNIQDLVENGSADDPKASDNTYAKLTVGTEPTETKILGIPWNERDDSFTINLSECTGNKSGGHLTKRKMLSKVNHIFDLLGIAAPVTIVGKLLYSEVCLQNLKWDEQVPSEVQRRWEKWLQSIKEHPSLTIPRSVVGCGATGVVLHGFSDASKLAIGAAIYALSFYSNQHSRQHLLVGKARVAPKHLSIPRLELVAAHLLSKLMKHVQGTVREDFLQECHCWTDSTTVLFWIHGQGTWSVFVRNRTRAIKEGSIVTWRYVPTKENPSDLGSRGAPPSNLSPFWLRGPDWLKDPERWPTQPEVCETLEAKQEKVVPKADKLLQATHVQVEQDASLVSAMLTKYSSYWRLLRITAYIKRFCHNCRGNRMTGPLTTEEMNAAEHTWIMLAQQSEDLTSVANLQGNAQGILRYVGRVPGYSPIYLPRHHSLVRLLISHHHRERLHGGVSITIGSLRERFWIPKLRSLVKSVVHKCNVCRRYRAKAIPASSKSNLPLFRTEFADPFAVTGVDFAGPIIYKHLKTTGKAYIALFTCASTRAVHLKLCPDLSANEFKRALKEFIARQGCPQVMVSDNGKTFVATNKWLSTLKKNNDLASFIGRQQIVWKFNLSRAPWWGGFFERLIGVMKRCLSKVIGRKLLNFGELEEVLLDVEQTMNNRPLSYQGEDFDQPVLTPNVLLRGRCSPVLDEDLHVLEEEITKRAVFVQKNKEHLRKRFLREYVHALEERQRNAKQSTGRIPKIGEVVLLKGDTKDKAKWKLGRVVRNVTGNDGVVRGLKLKLGNGYIVERPLQLVCDLELGGEDMMRKLDPKAQPFVPQQRPTRGAKQAAKDLMKSIQILEDEEL